MQMFMQFGVLNPDGTPGPVVTQARQAQAAGAMAGDEMPGAVPGQPPAAEPSQIWTPDAGGGETGSSGGGKLWTPD